jgi:hypothetical protein
MKLLGCWTAGPDRHRLPALKKFQYRAASL